jgi:hypothetical protein
MPCDEGLATRVREVLGDRLRLISPWVWLGSGERLGCS